MKKLIPAICMLLVAASLLGTSTYAWFSMNTQVTATGMEVKATTTANLVISAAVDGTFDVSAKKTNIVSTLMPATSKSGATILTVDSKKADAYNVATITGLSKDDLIPATENTNYTSTTFYIKTESGTMSGLYIKEINITGAGAGDEISKALRVAVTWGGETKIYAPVSGATISYTSTDNVSTDLASVSLNDMVNTDTFTTSVTKTAADVTIKIWYEGQDEACHSQNAGIATGNSQISVVFEVTG